MQSFDKVLIQSFNLKSFNYEVLREHCLINKRMGNEEKKHVRVTQQVKHIKLICVFRWIRESS